MRDLVSKAFLLMVINMSCVTILSAQEYISPTAPAKVGRSPGVKAKLLSTNGKVKTYALIFSTGDEVVSGLTEFAKKYEIKNAHYTGIGDANSAKVGWYDKNRKMFKVIDVPDPSEITSLVGDIAVFEGNPAAHSHVNLADEKGISHGGHLLELFVGPTLEVFVTTEETPLFKRLNTEYNATTIDLTQEN